MIIGQNQDWKMINRKIKLRLIEIFLLLTSLVSFIIFTFSLILKFLDDEEILIPKRIHDYVPLIVFFISRILAFILSRYIDKIK